MKVLFPVTELISKRGKVLGARVTCIPSNPPSPVPSSKKKKILTDRLYLQTQVQVTAKEQFFKSSLIIWLSRKIEAINIINRKNKKEKHERVVAVILNKYVDALEDKSSDKSFI